MPMNFLGVVFFCFTFPFLGGEGRVLGRWGLNSSAYSSRNKVERTLVQFSNCCGG